jgi:hypothetical protein
MKADSFPFRPTTAYLQTSEAHLTHSKDARSTLATSKNLACH